MDLVFFWSAQKYELLGVDRISAGILEVHSNDEALARALARLPGQLDGGDYQMLTHLQHARPMVDAYPRLHAANARSLRERLIEQLPQDAHLKVAPCSDAHLTFVALEPSVQAAGGPELDEHLCSIAQATGFSLVARDSFGFNHAALYAQGHSLPLRISVGTEPEEHGALFAEQLSKLDQDLRALATWRKFERYEDGTRSPVPVALEPFFEGRKTALRWWRRGEPDSREAQSWPWAADGFERFTADLKTKNPSAWVSIDQLVVGFSVGLAYGLKQNRLFGDEFARAAADLLDEVSQTPHVWQRVDLLPVADSVSRLARSALEADATKPGAWSRVLEAAERLSERGALDARV
jgi:hypothetical protein